MAVSIVNKKQTAGGATATLAITSATAGNLLVAFINQAATTAAPTAKDNLGTAGWTVHATHAIYSASANSLYVAYKTAVGGETELNPTVGAGGTLQGLSYFELSGASETVDAITHKDNIAASNTATSEPTTTTDAGDAILAAVGANLGSGTVTAWTGTGPMTNVETVSTRCIGGSLIPAATESAVTFTANWTTATIKSGLLVAAFKPAGAAVSLSGTVKVTTGASASATDRQGLGGTVKVTTGASASATDKQGLGATIKITTVAFASVTDKLRLGGTVNVVIGASGSVTTKSGSPVNLAGTVSLIIGASAKAGTRESLGGTMKVVTSTAAAVGNRLGLGGAIHLTTGAVATPRVRVSLGGTVAVVIGAVGSVTVGNPAHKRVIYSTVTQSPRIALTITHSQPIPLSVAHSQPIPLTTKIE